MRERTCKRCGKTKPIDNFWKSARGKDGYVSVCADCLNKARKHDDGVYDPVLTKGWPKKANGLYKMYWELDD